MLYNLKIKQEPPDEQPFSPSSQTTGILLYTFSLLKKSLFLLQHTSLVLKFVDI